MEQKPTIEIVTIVTVFVLLFYEKDVEDNCTITILLPLKGKIVQNAMQ